MKSLGLVVSDKKIYESFILKTYLLTPWPTYATNWNGLNNFDRGPPRDHSCVVWSKSNKRFQRTCCLKKLLTDARTDARTPDARHWTITKAHLSTLCSGELKNQLNKKLGNFKSEMEIKYKFASGKNGQISPPNLSENHHNMGFIKLNWILI